MVSRQPCTSTLLVPVNPALTKCRHTADALTYVFCRRVRWPRRVSTPVGLKAPTICMSTRALTSHGSCLNNSIRCPAGAGADDGVGRHRRHELGAFCDCTRLQHGGHGPAALHLVAAHLPEVFRTHVHPPETCMHPLADTSLCGHCHHCSHRHPHGLTPAAFSAPGFSKHTVA